MDSRKFIWKKTLILALGQLGCVGVMIGVFALLGYFDRSVLLGGIFGGLLAVANFFVMAVCADLAADKAQAQKVKAGQTLVQMSALGRLLVIAVVLFALIKSGVCNVWTAVLPLVFTRPILTFGEFFGKGDNKT